VFLFMQTRDFFGRALHHCQFFAPNRLLGSKTKHATQSQYGAMGELEDCDTATQRDIPGNRTNMGRLQGTEFSLWPWHIEIVDLPIKMCFFLHSYAMFVYQSVMFMIIIVMIVMMMLIVIYRHHYPHHRRHHNHHPGKTSRFFRGCHDRLPFLDLTPWLNRRDVRY